MLIKSTALKLYNQLSQLDPNKVSLITYNPKWNYLVYQQDGKSIILTSASTTFIPTRNLRYLILTPAGYNKLMTDLQNLINSKADEELMTLVPTKVGFEVHQSRTNALFPYPVKIFSCKFYDIKNKLVITLMYSAMYKGVNNPLKAYKKSLKVQGKNS